MKNEAGKSESGFWLIFSWFCFVGSVLIVYMVIYAFLKATKEINLPTTFRNWSFGSWVVVIVFIYAVGNFIWRKLNPKK